MAVFIISLFIFGLIIGSFLNVVVYRSVHGDSFIYGRSKCPKCKAKIQWYDNIPLLSFVLLRGKCRHCGKQISWSYPIIELMTGLLFVWWYLIGNVVFRLTTEPFTILQPAFWLLVGICLIVVFFADLLYGVIPNGAVLGLSALGIVYRVTLTLMGIMRLQDFTWSLSAAVVITGVFLGLWYITKKKGMGLGDVKLMFPLALVTGWPDILVAVFVASCLGAIIGIELIIAGKKRFGQTLPFGPFLVIGTFTALLFGDKLVQWYLSLL